MNFEGISHKLTHVLAKEADYSSEQKEIMAYAIETMLLSFVGAFLIVVIGYFLNALFSAVIAASFGGILRRLSGGAHFNTPTKCLVFGAIIYSLIGVLAQTMIDHHFVSQLGFMSILLLSFLIVAILAPVDSESKPIHSQSLKKKLRLGSLVFIGLSSFMVFISGSETLIVSATLGIMYQSLTLLPIFNQKRG